MRSLRFFTDWAGYIDGGGIGPETGREWLLWGAVVRPSTGGTCGLAYCRALACRWPDMTWPVLGGVLLDDLAGYWLWAGQVLAGHL